jgi:hypothetical protein
MGLVSDTINGALEGRNIMVIVSNVPPLRG